MKLSIVIPVFNNWKFTDSVLKYFYKFNDKNIEIIIFDNGSNDDTQNSIQFFLDNMDNLIYIRESKNLGFAAAVNRAFDKSSGKYIMFLNNDIIFATSTIEWVNDIIDCVKDNKKCLVGPAGGFIDNNFNFKYETSDPEKPINYMSGWCLTASRHTWNSLILKNECGPFDSKTFYVYFEDTDLGFRAIEENVKFILHKIPVKHIGKQTSKHLNINKLYNESKSKFIQKWKNSTGKNK